MKAPLVAQTPQQIAESRPQCRQQYSHKHLKWLTQVIVMTYGKKEDHQFTAALNRWALKYIKQNPDDIPESFPHSWAIQAIKMRADSVQSGLVLQRQVILMKQVADWKAQADHTAKALRYTALKSRVYAR